MIAGKQNISDWFAATGKAYWILYDHNKTDSGVFRGRSNDSDGATHTTAQSELADALRRISYGKYTLAASDTPKLPTRGYLKEDFEISSFETTPAAQNQPSVSGIPEGYVSKSDMQSMINKALDEHKKELELVQLRKDLAETKKELRAAEQQDGLSRLAGIAADIFPMFKDQIVAKVAGIPEQLPHIAKPIEVMPTDAQPEVVEITDEQRERLSLAVGAFVEAAPDEWLELLERMAAKVRSNPAIINSLKAFL